MILSHILLLLCIANANAMPPSIGDDTEILYDSDSSRTLSPSPSPEIPRVQRTEVHKSRPIKYAQLASDPDQLVASNAARPKVDYRCIGCEGKLRVYPKRRNCISKQPYFSHHKKPKACTGGSLEAGLDKMAVRRMKDLYNTLKQDGLDIYITGMGQDGGAKCFSINESDTISDNKRSLVVYSNDGNRRFSLTPGINTKLGHHSAVDIVISTMSVIDDNFGPVQKENGRWVLCFENLLHVI